MIKEYYWLTKPGIIYGNSITTLGGFFLGSKGDVDFLLLLATLAGISLVIASACVFNNVFDRDIDSKMPRTKNRAMVTGSISKRNAIMFATGLLVLGGMILYLYTNLLALSIALLGFGVYTLLYTPLKSRTVYATLIGSISGATPPVVGYLAVTHNFDLGPILLFIILVTWQMPHFYAIAIYRLEDYAAASIPVLPIKQGINVTKIQMLCYIIAFIVAVTTLTIYGYTGYFYLAVIGLLGLVWFWFGIRGFKTNIDDKLWARKMFKFSLVVLTVFSIMISINN